MGIEKITYPVHDDFFKLDVWNNNIKAIVEQFGTDENRLTAVEKKAGANTTNIGTLSNLTTKEKGSLVGAVNEVNSDLADAVKNMGSGDGVIASKLQTARNIALTGAVKGNVNFDGSGNVSIETTLTNGSFGNTVNWNTLIKEGVYNAQGAVMTFDCNAPIDEYSYGQLIVYKTNFNTEYRFTQIYVPHQAYKYSLWIRVGNGNDINSLEWTPWVGLKNYDYMIGTLSNLGTTEKGTLVGAINELKTITEQKEYTVTLDSIAQSVSGVMIDDINANIVLNKFLHIQGLFHTGSAGKTISSNEVLFSITLPATPSFLYGNNKNSSYGIRHVTIGDENTILPLSLCRDNGNVLKIKSLKSLKTIENENFSINMFVRVYE